MVVTTTAHAASLSMQKSNSRKGDEIMRAAMYSSMVSLRSRICAAGLALARSRQATAIRPSCSCVVPCSVMWRWAMRAKIWPGVSSP